MIKNFLYVQSLLILLGLWEILKSKQAKLTFLVQILASFFVALKSSFPVYALSLLKAIKLKIERRVIAKETLWIKAILKRNNDTDKEWSKEN